MGRREAEAWKRRLGTAPTGSAAYMRNASIILSQYAGTRREDTLRKLHMLAASDDPVTAQIARDALNGKPYR